MNDDNLQLSVVAPVYNEAEGIEQVVRYWTEVVRRNNLPYEIVLANDGSTDSTLQILERLSKEDSCVRFVSYSPNRGYGYALKEAIRASKGELVVTLDSDGQFDLADLPKLMALYHEKGLDFVTGYRMK